MAKLLSILLACILCAALLPAHALAEECFLIDVDTLDMNSVNQSAYVQAHLSAPAQGIRVSKYISNSNELAARVRLTVTHAETSAVVFDKSYGYVSGTFDSGDIYLPFVDNNTIPYIVTLNIEDWTYAMPFMQLQSRLTGNTGCTYGVRLRDANASLTGTWVMGTMLDLDTLRSQGSLVLSVCASNAYTVGQATVSVAADQLSVSLALDTQADVQVQSSAVYLIANVAAMTTADPAAMPETAYSLGQPIDISGLRTAFLYVPISLNFDPTGLPEFVYDAGSAELATQWALWYDNLQNGGYASVQVDTATQDPLPEEATEAEAAPQTDADAGDAVTEEPVATTEETPTQ